MADLGDFTAAVREHQRADDEQVDTFRLFDVTFGVTNEIDGMAMLEFGKLAAEGVDSTAPEGIAAIHDLLRAIFVTEPVVDSKSGTVIAHDWRRFRGLCREKRLDQDDLLDLCGELLEAYTGRPTERPSSSQAGPSTATPSSKRPSISDAEWDERMRAMGMVPAMELASELGSSAV